MTLQTTKRFDKAFARLSVRDQQRVEAALTLFMDQPFHPVLKNHGLVGKLRGLRAFSAAMICASCMRKRAVMRGCCC